MKVTNQIIWNHRGRVSKDGTGELEIRITCDRKSYYIGTGIKVRKTEWVAGQIVDCPGAKELNDRLVILYKKVLACVNARIEENMSIDIDDIRRDVWQTADSQTEKAAFLEWTDRQIGMLQVSEGTRKHYYPLLARLKDFKTIRNWKDVTVENIYAFDAWLHQTDLSDAGIYNYHKCLKAMLNRAVEFNRLDRNPYDRLKGKFKRGDKQSVEYLTEDEMERFESLTLPEGSPLDTARDLFVFQMYTGLPYSDMMAFDINEYKWDGARYNNNGERIKTGVPYVSSILTPALNVLKKHGMKVPYMCNADYNRHLKALGLMAGIRTRLHSHLARHTFATYMLRNGAKIENVSRMLGHTNITQTQRYAKVLAQSVHDDFDRMEEKLKAKKKRND